MLKKNIKSFNTNIFNCFDKGNIILTAGDKFIGLNGMTISWGGLGTLWNRNVCYIFVRKSRYTHEFLDKTDSVSLSFLSDKYNDALKLFGSKSGRNIDKFSETGLHHSFEPDYNGYFITEADYVLKCKKIYSIDLNLDNLNPELEIFYKDNDIHTMYVLEIYEYLVNEE